MSSKRLKEYSAYCAVFLTTSNNLAAQVIYTDIEPDVVLQDDDSGYSIETFGIDMDEDEVYDFVFINFTNSDAWYIGVSHFNIERIWVGAWDTFANGIAAKSTSVIVSDTFYRYYPFALDQSDIIANNLDFEGDGYQRMTAKSKKPGFGTIYHEWCYWYPEVYDHYLGIRFKDTTENMHYGWIRCTVQDSGRTLIIKDYAYEQIPDHPIIAGGTETYLPVQEIIETENDIQLFPNPAKDFITLLSSKEKIVSVRLLTIAGAELKNTYNNGNNVIDISALMPGLYFARIDTETGRKVTLSFVKAEQ